MPGLRGLPRLPPGSVPGVLLIGATVLALVFANSGLRAAYEEFLGLPVVLAIGEFRIDKPLLLWVNDGLMAVFFFMVGLELKREFLQDSLSQPGAWRLPALAAIGGIAVPSGIYTLVNLDHPAGIDGWAIPAATDIAFSLGLLSLLGPRVPNALKAFLVSLAILDDIGAILIIALFYTDKLSSLSLGAAALCLMVLFIFQRCKLTSVAAYIWVGLVMWAALLKSGVHATLAGVLLAMFIPLRTQNSRGRYPAKDLEHDLHHSVSYLILPLFAFANAGVVLDAEAMGQVFAPIPMGIVLGLAVGKPVGIMLSSWVGVRLGLCRAPDFRWREMFGLSCLCGVGFTMSLFIASLAFQQGGTDNLAADRLGILIGSLLSAICGLTWLALSLPRQPEREPA